MDGSHAIGVDLGGTKILAGVVTRDGEVLRGRKRATPQDSQDSDVPAEPGRAAGVIGAAFVAFATTA